MTIGGGEVRADRDLLLDRVDYAIEAARLYAGNGGGTMVDMNPIDCGRRIEELVRISRESGVHIIACTGFQRAIYYEATHWVYNYPEDEIARLITEEITEGIEINNYNGPIVHRSSARAGVIKAGTEYNHILPGEHRMLVAAAMAHKNTGAPISTHTERGTMALEQVNALESLGVPSSSMIIGHIDRNPDLGYHKKVARRGVFLGYDGPSRVKYWPDEVIIDLIKGMLDAGFGDRILLGGDNGRRSYWPEYGGGPGHSYILTTFAPRLREEGIPEDAIRRMLIDNPERAFSFIQ